ncbi:hypothetical protein CB0940_03075 [Cercospora beticola]|uniref:Uncharacterized protein n=1 Tax=Cercospora beticola TaxID=122368 RepID=A0A2G5I292_CERBT|nr:hypothetical protein CB0940_03075 [Cercospora beticola]PIA98633.1 hypothetical protein CB0940_03075 [Cercospora beticola]WPB00241.1 hypothetical protein RHO25_004860 [Cercospora beticola]CAK1361564.1 unnamed protein product [Cercospora beticola]
MHDTNALRQADSDLAALVRRVQEQAATLTDQAQRDIDQLQTENANLKREVKLLKELTTDSKPLIKQELSEAAPIVAQVIKEKDADIKELVTALEEEKALVCSLRVQVDCQKGATQGVKQQAVSARAKLGSTEKKLAASQKKTAKLEREIKKLQKNQNAAAPSGLCQGISAVKKSSAHAGIVSLKRVAADEDDEDDVPIAQLRNPKQRMDLDDIPLRLRSIAMKVEVAFGGPGTKSTPIELD